jgi:hypothetical protein
VVAEAGAEVRPEPVVPHVGPVDHLRPRPPTPPSIGQYQCLLVFSPRTAFPLSSRMGLSRVIVV